MAKELLRVPLIPRHRHLRQAVKKNSAVAAGGQTRVADPHDTAVRHVANETTNTLFQCYDGRRNLQVAKRIPSTLAQELDEVGVARPGLQVERRDAIEAIGVDVSRLLDADQESAA